MSAEGKGPLDTDRGVASSFDDLFTRNVAYVHRTLARLGVPERDLDDAAQEVWLRVYERWPEADRQRPERPWLFTFAYHYAANYRRLARHRNDSFDEARGESATRKDDPERNYEERRARALVLRVLGAMPTERREVFVACELSDLTAPEAAQLFDIPVGTVYSRLRAAREEFTHRVRRDAATTGRPSEHGRAAR